MSVGMEGEMGPQVTPRLAADHPLRAVADLWMKKVKAAIQFKKPFDDDAQEAMNFFDGPANWMWKDRNGNDPDLVSTTTVTTIAPPTFRITINRVFEAVKLFGAVMYHRNPTRTVTPVKWLPVDDTMFGIPADLQSVPPEQQPQVEQMMQAVFTAFQQTNEENLKREQSARILQAYLNYTPDQLNLKDHGKRWVDEAIIKGLGVLWTEAVDIPGSEVVGPDGVARPQQVIGSFYDTVDNYLLDPDADSIDSVRWVAKKCTEPAIDVAARYGIPLDDLTRNVASSTTAKTKNDPKENSNRKRRPGETLDQVVYYKIWSKCGFGSSLKGFPKSMRGAFDSLGQHCYIVIAEGVEYPLNAPPNVMPDGEMDAAPDDLLGRVSWPIPFWVDPGGWPCVELAFHRKPNYPYPISHIKPGIGELRFLNWAASWLCSRIATSCETLIGVAKAAGDELKRQITGQTFNGIKVIELEEAVGKKLDEIISVFQMPEVSPEIWKVIAAVADMFDKRVGLTELAYGMSRASFRSAAEATTKAEQISVRPDDMANTLEDAMGRVARNEAIAARWLLTQEDVAPSLGPMAALSWEQHVASRHYRQIQSSFLYRVESGSSRKPNVASRVEQMQQALQTVGPILAQLIPTGVVGPFNALLKDWGESLSIDTTRYMVPEPPPPPPVAAPAPGLPPSQGDPSAPGGPPPTPDAVPPELSPGAPA
jgi:hypothetical protein